MAKVPDYARYVIIGAGIHGLSTAMHLTLRLKAQGTTVGASGIRIVVWTRPASAPIRSASRATLRAGCIRSATARFRGADAVVQPILARLCTDAIAPRHTYQCRGAVARTVGLKGPQPPSCGDPVRLRSSTQDLPRRTTHDGARGPRRGPAGGRESRHRSPRQPCRSARHPKAGGFPDRATPLCRECSIYV